MSDKPIDNTPVKLINTYTEDGMSNAQINTIELREQSMNLDPEDLTAYEGIAWSWLLDY